MKLEEKITLAVEEASKVLNLTFEQRLHLGLIFRQHLLTPIPKECSYNDYSGACRMADILDRTYGGKYALRPHYGGGLMLLSEEEVMIGKEEETDG